MNRPTTLSAYLSI